MRIKANYILPTLFGAGYFPKAPGTFASVVAFVPILFMTDDVRSYLLTALCLVSFVVSLPMIRKIEAERGNDASIIVIDEAVGVWLIFSSPFIHINVLNAIVGIGLFRAFDILKPGVISRINARSGAVFVMLDDVAAAIISSILLHIFCYIMQFIGILKVLDFAL